MTASPSLVIKLGGSVEDPGPVLDGIAAHGGPVILVHGAHRVLDDLATRLGQAPRFVTSAAGAVSRYTDATAMDHFLMAYCGVVNKRLVQQLLQRGVTSVGLAAMDGGMVRGRRRDSIRVREGDRTLVLHGDHAGSIEAVDAALLHLLLERRTVPVLCPPALGHDGLPINVDGDRLAAELAIAVGAERLVIFSDAPGFLANPDDRESTVGPATLGDIDGLRAAARGRARVKLVAVERALRGGVASVGLCDGTRPAALGDALRGAGSWFAAGAALPA